MWTYLFTRSISGANSYF